ncbi:MAG: DNA repair protein RecO [Candidatus Pacebacteria bacterium]|jgi:DNA repair protein RecO (recombination protein O)|nr:DNA repair protein RecO [Candidatus Paceibacterota bacterium]|tara:strand:- start:15370 stop:15960 length:591 start_codon:yes stop_codon:yes gene_type:complete
MHTLYNTQCIVLGGTDAGEGSKYISLFTKDIGLVRAVAKSVREEKSKLRYSLQDFSVGEATLVRGKDVWRITGARQIYSINRALRSEREKLYAVVQILGLLQKLLHGEEKNDYLFNAVSFGLEFVKENKINTDILKSFEHLIVLRILYSLGYIAKKDNFVELLRSTQINEGLLENTLSMRKEIIFSINRAFKEAHL